MLRFQSTGVSTDELKEPGVQLTKTNDNGGDLLPSLLVTRRLLSYSCVLHNSQPVTLSVRDRVGCPTDRDRDRLFHTVVTDTSAGARLLVDTYIDGSGLGRFLTGRSKMQASLSLQLYSLCI